MKTHGSEHTYGIRKATVGASIIPEIDLYAVPHQGRTLLVSDPAFGPGTFSANVEEMAKIYMHSAEHRQITFREPTTAESIARATYNFAIQAKPEIFDSRWLQSGRIARTSKGVFANHPRNSNEQTLKSYLNKAKKVNGIWLLPNGKIEGVIDFGFVPYESFQTGVQDCDTFAQSGLARLLEHTQETSAAKLREIASPRNYKLGVNVWGFEPTTELTERVLSLGSNRNLGDGRLLVGGYNWDGDWGDGVGGYAFGVLQE